MAVDAMTNTKQDTERKRFIPNGVMCSACAWHQSEKCERKYSCVEMQAAYDQGWQARTSQEPRPEDGPGTMRMPDGSTAVTDRDGQDVPRPAGGELREAFEAKARERAGFAEHDLHQTLPGVYDGILVRAAWEGCIFGAAFAAYERGEWVTAEEVMPEVRRWLCGGGDGHEDGEDGIRAGQVSMESAIEIAAEFYCYMQNPSKLPAPPAEKGEGR